MTSRTTTARWRFWTKITVSLFIAAGFGYLVHSQGIPLLPHRDQLAQVLDRWWGPLGFLLCLCGVHVLRAYRWLYLLRPLVKKKVPLKTLFAVAFAGFMAIMALPLRTGELARPYLISTKGHVGMGAAFGTIAIERVLDGLILAGTLTACLQLLQLEHGLPDWASYAGLATLALFVVALAVLIFMLWKGESAVRLLENLGSKIWPALASKVANVLREFLRGLSALPNLSHLFPFLLLSLAYWGLNGVGMWFLGRSLGLDISLVGGFTVMTMLAVGILIPTGPGQLGNFQAAVAAALSLQNLPAGQLEGPGSVYIFILYLGILCITFGAGGIALTTEHINMMGAISQHDSDSHQ